MSKAADNKLSLEILSSLVRDHPFEIAALNQFSADLFKYERVPEVASSILAHLANLLPIKSSLVLLYHPTDKCLKAVGSSGLSKSKAEKLKIKLSDSPIGTSVKRQRPLFIEDVASSRYRQELPGVSSFLILPIRVGADQNGAIVASIKRMVKFDVFSRELLERFLRVSEQALTKSTINEKLLREIAERKQVEEALKKVRERLEDEVAQRTKDLTKANIILRSQITERKKTEENLIKLSSVVEQADDNVFITNKDGLIEYVNPSFERLTGFKKEAVLGKTPRIIKSGKHDKKFYERLWGTIIKGKVFHGILINRRKDGELYYEEKTITPIKDSRGDVTHFVSTGNDITDRKLTEEALAASEHKYSTLVEKGNDGIIIIQDGVLKFVNQKAAEITGFSVKSAIGRPFTDFIAPEYKKLVLERYKRRLRGEEIPRIYEIKILSKGGKKIPVEINASLIEHEGKPADMAIIRDITEHKEAERRLEEEKKKMETIFTTTRDGLALYDAQARVVSFNPSLAKLFGVKENIGGTSRVEIANNRDKYFRYKMERSDDSIKTHQEVLAGKTITNVLIKIYSRPTKYLEGTYVPIKDEQGKVVGMIASFRDVTMLKNQAEKISQQLVEAERQKNRWKAVFENVEEGVHIMDKDLKIISANAACELMSGRTEKEMVGKRFYDIFRCHDPVGHYFPEFDPVSKLLATKEAIPYDEHLHMASGGIERWVGVSYTPVFNEAGDIEQIVSVIRDITTLKELEKAKSEFVSVTSHELRTPLTVVKGYLSLLLSGDLGKFDDPGFQANFQTALNKVYNETNRLTKLVEDLLNVSRIENGRIRLSLRKVTAAEVINEVVKEFNVLAQNKGIRLEVKYDLGGRENSCCVLADKDKFKQILVNLIDNAIKYTGSGGRISIECHQENGFLHTQVNDTGAGIPPNILPRIFEKFQQGGVSVYLKENKGTGLGLFVVKSLVELHKGQIWVDSAAGKGTRFTFTLPLVAAS